MPPDNRQQTGAHNTTRLIGRWSLLFTGLSAIIGSGWLFGAAQAASLAGSGAVLAWVIGGLIAMSVALLATELGTMFPVAGSMVRISQATHGRPLGFLVACATWFALTAVIPIEAVASVQYMSGWPLGWAKNLYAHGALQTPGLLIAGGLVIIYFLLNFWGMRIFARINSAVTILKLAVPLITALSLLAAAWHTSPHVVTPIHSHGFTGILTAVASAGIVFAYNGFQNPINFAGEARDPGRSVPFATLGSVLIAILLYVLLQCSFLTAAHAGVADLNGLDLASPFLKLAVAFQLNIVVVLLYGDAFISPSGTGATGMAISARLALGMQRNGTAPAILGTINAHNHTPRPALWLALMASFVMLFFFRSWSILAAIISISVVIPYLMIPISVLSFRARLPDYERPWRVPAIKVMGPLGFIFASWLLYWARWPLCGEVSLVVLACVPLYLCLRRGDSWATHWADLTPARWFMAYLGAMAALSYAGSPEFGGHGWLAYPFDLVAVAVIAVLFCHWGVASSYRIPDLTSVTDREPN